MTITVLSAQFLWIFSKAFNMISHDLLFAKLAAFGIYSPNLALLHSYLRDRSQA